MKATCTGANSSRDTNLNSLRDPSLRRKSLVAPHRRSTYVEVIAARLKAAPCQIAPREEIPTLHWAESARVRMGQSRIEMHGSFGWSSFAKRTRFRPRMTACRKIGSGSIQIEPLPEGFISGGAGNCRRMIYAHKGGVPGCRLVRPHASRPSGTKLRGKFRRWSGSMRTEERSRAGNEAPQRRWEPHTRDFSGRYKPQ